MGKPKFWTWETIVAAVFIFGGLGFWAYEGQIKKADTSVVPQFDIESVKPPASLDWK